ncbi:hypothetical protein NDU88_005082 [Pleurodeles waltl]|uniref:Uncharacterized protein n=1 Tax=Pleurodeles waltl TaxID=8319 RepID=A0AAV7PEN3_PLEWA|nr:hypothetical protein NDU88_005082 [Pleurodeles waltl]
MLSVFDAGFCVTAQEESIQCAGHWAAPLFIGARTRAQGRHARCRYCRVAVPPSEVVPLILQDASGAVPGAARPPPRRDVFTALTTLGWQSASLLPSPSDAALSSHRQGWRHRASPLCT